MPRFTYQDYLLLTDDKRYEVFDGELWEVPATTVRHQLVQANLMYRMMAHVEPAKLGHLLLGPTDVILSDMDVVQPDILFITKEREGIINWNGGIHGAPDLVVEILLPLTTDRDQVIKRKLYDTYGVREYWIVDPLTTCMEVFTLGPTGLETARVYSTGSTLISPLLPGLAISIDNIFAM